jgi:hypothetical protein
MLKIYSRQPELSKNGQLFDGRLLQNNQHSIAEVLRLNARYIAKSKGMNNAVTVARMHPASMLQT